jgi:uncharacterized protein
MGPFEDFRETRTVLLTTRKRDGTTVGTPVHLALGLDGSAYFRTWSATGKVKRIRNFPQVWIAPSTMSGKPTGPTRQATAHRLLGPEAAAAADALAHKYPIMQGLLVPAFHRLTKKTTVHYVLLPSQVA